jgi:transcriptional activator HAC1
MEALRLVSEKRVDQVEELGARTTFTRDDLPESVQWQDTAALPSKEVLLTLLWAIKMEERKQRGQNYDHPRPLSNTQATNLSYVLTVANKRKLGMFQGSSTKRCRLG